jgi:hypothetical protein
MQVHQYHHPDTGWTNVSGSIQRVGWEGREQAEEGATPIFSVTVDDPDLELDFKGLRAYRVLEDASTSEDDVILSGYIADQEIGRGTVAPDRRWTGRVWFLSVTDRNAVWQRRVMRGADCKRPEETDVERVAWLLSTAEAGTFDDVDTFVDTTNGKAMDATDYRTRMFGDVIDDCAQQSGRNWYVRYSKVDDERILIVHYRFDDDDAYSSTLSLSNDLADLTPAALRHQVATVYGYSKDTRVRRDPSRVFSGVQVPYDGGNTFVERTATKEEFGRRETVMPAVSVRTKAKADARGARWLADCREQDERVIIPQVIVPASLATSIRAGMRLPYKNIIAPGYEDFVDTRVLICSPTPLSHQLYGLALELQSPRGLHDGPDSVPEGEAYAVLYAGEGVFAGGEIWYDFTGDAPGSGWGASSTGHVGPIATVGPFTFITGGAPTARAIYAGIELDGGNVSDTTIKAGWSIVGVAEGDVSVTYQLLVNGAVIGSVTTNSAGVGARHFGDIQSVTVTGVDLVDGDIVKTRVVKSGTLHYFLMPWGAGHNGEALEIIGGTIS